jgi:RNAse (barnase) inhibitor barstar
MQEYVVDLTNVNSWSDFIAAFNNDFVRGFGDEWNSNLDAFNDYLWRPEQHPYRLVLRGWQSCVSALDQKKTRDGRTVLEVVDEIFRSNPQIEVIKN